ncbi:MAG: hypothetical protein PQJ44_04265 [Sphaerochaetaceae bacterium]|nr:hypothetical protein [Sphaerochaetaceae bacterium]
MIKFVVVLFIFISSVLAEEISVFGAGDLNSKNPYGLNQNEKEILKAKNDIDKVDDKVKNVKSSVNYINERIEGLESIYEGDSKKLHETVLKINEAVGKINKNAEDIKALLATDTNVKNVLNQLLTLQEETSSENAKNLKNLKLAIDKLTRLVNDINKKYVSSKELDKNMNQFITKKEFEDFKKAVAKDLTTLGGSTTVSTNTTSTKSSKLQSDKSNSKLIVEAREYFKKDYFTKAKPIFLKLVEENYRPAESNYYLGEISYYRKQYKTAIKYFKKSALLYDKASYMPRLLLHSAISFEKVGDIENASVFYNTLLDNFPNSSEAKEVKKSL